MSSPAARPFESVQSATHLIPSQTPVNQGIDSASQVGNFVLSAPQGGVTPMREREVGQGHLNLESRRTNSLATASNSGGVTSIITAVNSGGSPVEAPVSGLIAVRLPQPDPVFDEANFEKYLSSDKAQMVFSTAAMHGQGSSRAVDLKKKVDGEEVDDGNRQQKVNVQFAKIKHGIGVSGRDWLPDKAISYSLTWHFVEVYDRPGEPPKRYDLVDIGDIKKLLEDQGVDDVSPERVNRLYTELLAINKELKGLTENEVGKTKDAFVHDYIGNPNGLKLFSPSSKQDMQVKSSKTHGKYTRTLRDFGLVEKQGFLSSDRLTPSGAKAFNHIRESRSLQASVFKQLNGKIKTIEEKLEGLRAEEESTANAQDIQKHEAQLHDFKRVRNEISSASRTAMDFTTMELSKTHTHKEKQWDSGTGTFNSRSITQSGQLFLEPVQGGEGPADMDAAAALKITNERRFSLAKKATQDYTTMLSRETRNGLPLIGGNYVPTKQDKQKAIEVGSLVYHLTGGETRLGLIEAQQRLGRQAFGGQANSVGSEVFREPNAEKFLLNGTFNIARGDAITEDHLVGYRGEPKHVQNELLLALGDFQSSRTKLTSHNAGESL